MIRKMIAADIDKIMEIWLQGNLSAHSFIPKGYWHANFEYVKNAIPQSDVFVYVDGKGVIQGFAGVSDGYIAGLFVKDDCQGQGIGTALLDRCKQNYELLTLDVYLQNKRAIAFYEKNGFFINGRKSDEHDGFVEYTMMWESENRQVKLLVAGFDGADNAANVLLDKLAVRACGEKLILKNSFALCTEQIRERLSRRSFERVIAFGQKPMIRDKIYIETCAHREEDIIRTDYPFEGLERRLHDAGYKVVRSKNAGDYLCNHVYYEGMSFIRENSLDAKMLFIHIPILKNIGSIDRLSAVFTDYLSGNEEAPPAQEKKGKFRGWHRRREK